MATLRLILFCMYLSLFGLWFPSSSGAVLSSVLCQGLGNGIWAEWLAGTLPKTDATIDKVAKIKQDCPQLSGSMNRIENDIKAGKQKVQDAKQHLQDHCAAARAAGLTGHFPSDTPGLALNCH